MDDNSWSQWDYDDENDVDHDSGIILPTAAADEDAPNSFFRNHHDEEEKEALVVPSATTATATASFLRTAKSSPTSSSAPPLPRVSSCYFSIHSQRSGDDDDLFQSTQDLLNLVLLIGTTTANNNNNNSNNAWHYQSDILQHMFSFLDVDSLKSVSETNHGWNQECCLLLQRRLQHVDTKDTLVLQRLDTHSKDSLLKDYHNECGRKDDAAKSSSLPSFSRWKQLLQAQFLSSSSQSSSDTHTLAKAAVLMTLLGGAAAAMNGNELDPELATVLVKLGVFTSLVKAAQSMSEHTSVGRSSSTSAEEEKEYDIDDEHAHENDETIRSNKAKHEANAIHESSSSSSLTDRAQQLHRMLINHQGPLSRILQAAYCRYQSKSVETTPSSTKAMDSLSCPTDLSDSHHHHHHHHHFLRPPSGCVGIYQRTLHRARTLVRSHVQQERCLRFQALSLQEQQTLTRTFLDACMSDESLPVVQQLLPQVDVEGFYIGSDGSETCALHAAAFHGAIQVLEFLCQDIHASADASQDGGCCDINRQDSNGWTALHFCAGSNSVAAVQVLAKYGANWDLEAGNGYTPLQWAVRLQHHAVADELRRLAEEKARRRRRPRWIMARQPLAAIAKRFLAMMPMHSSSPSSFLHPVQPIRE